MTLEWKHVPIFMLAETCVFCFLTSLMSHGTIINSQSTYAIHVHEAFPSWNSFGDECRRSKPCRYMGLSGIPWSFSLGPLFFATMSPMSCVKKIFVRQVLKIGWFKMKLKKGTQPGGWMFIRDVFLSSEDYVAGNETVWLDAEVDLGVLRTVMSHARATMSRNLQMGF